MPDFKQKIQSEFRLEHLTLQHEQAEDFYKSQWQKGDRSLAFLVYRWLSALIWLLINLSVLIWQFYDGKFFIFLTNWGIMLCLATQLFGAILVTKWHFYQDYKTEMRLSLKIYWWLYDVTVSLAFLITIIYWCFLYGNGNKPVDSMILNILAHCFNTILMLVDLLIVAFPVRLLHGLYIIVVPLTFVIFSAIYSAFGGTDEVGNPFIYPILNWNEPQYIWVTLLGTLVLLLLCHCMYFGLSKIRVFMHRNCRNISNGRRIDVLY